LLDVVLTPKGEGIVIQDWPMSVGVRLHETQAVVYFERPEDILKIRVKSSLYAEHYRQALYSPTEWPYNDPAWTDERLTHMGEPTRAELGFPQPPKEGR
jgi:hypothetical protein